MNASHVLQRDDITSVAVFRALQLGDMLCAVPALRALRAALPRAQITLVGLPWASRFAERFDRYIDDFAAFPGHIALGEQPVRQEFIPEFYAALRARRFSLALQMHGSGESSNSVVKDFGARLSAGYAPPGAPHSDPCFYCLSYPDRGPEPLRLLDCVTALGAPNTGTHLEFPLTRADWNELEASGYGSGLKPGGYICIHPGARLRDKCWPPRRFAEVADRLAVESGFTIVLTGSEQERDLAREVAAHMAASAVNAAGPISVGAMAALMSRASLLVCNDTGVSHIAAGLRLKSVVIFSKADITRWAPLDTRLHRCVWDPAGEKSAEVLAQARMLLTSSRWPSDRTARQPAR